MQALLIGEENSRRTEFFLKAAVELSMPMKFIPYPSIDKLGTFNPPICENYAVKIDPPLPNSYNINDINKVGLHYSNFLKRLQVVKDAKFLNSPEKILHVMDKLLFKQSIENAGICTPSSYTRVNSISELRNVVIEKRLNGVFIKPRYGSGAAGAIAYRRNLRTGDEVIYTTVAYSSGQFYNNSKLRCVRDKRELETIVNYILQMGVIAEAWIPKASFAGMVYDLRVVWQFGKIEYATARLSSGTITNLHLGGKSIDISELNLSSKNLSEIEALCNKTMALFPGLKSAGLDILLEKGSLKPYVLEVNGHGDLLHKDIKAENKLYKSQLLYLKSLTEEQKNEY